MTNSEKFQAAVPGAYLRSRENSRLYHVIARHRWFRPNSAEFTVRPVAQEYPYSPYVLYVDFDLFDVLEELDAALYILGHGG